MWAAVLHIWAGCRAVPRPDDHEPEFLRDAAARNGTTPAWELVWGYHMARAAEMLEMYQTQDGTDGHHDVGRQLDVPFDRAGAAVVRGGLVRQEALARLAAGTAHSLVKSSI